SYLITESAPGYATISTGTTPSNHGIVSDYWFQRLKDYKQFCIEDNNLKNSISNFNNNKYSPKQLIGSTLGDELRLSNYKKSKVIGISIKNYAAILSSGHLANAAYWMDDETGKWTSSSYYLDSLPDWVVNFNDKKFTEIYLAKQWNTFLPIKEYRESLADNNSYEKGFKNLQKTFPYELLELSKKEGVGVIKYTPYGNTYTKDFALSAIVNEELGKDEYTDLITISFAASGYVNQIFGIRSVELQDIYLRLDKDIEHLLSFVDEQLSKEDVLIVLTSDRGSIDNPDFSKEVGMPTGRFNSEQAISVLESYLKAIYGRANWIKSYNNRQIYLNQILIDASKLQLSEVQLKAAQFMNQFKGVANATTATILQTTNFTSSILHKFQNSYNMERSGDVLINLEPGWIEENNKHVSFEYYKQSSPYKYDSHVPLIWYGWKINRGEILKPVNISDIVPTISNFLNLAYPSGSTGKPIENLVN
ncbi:MAG: alkaline phosphatase family protein, partial [Bacteroidales bacterium]|nr:alkaline phosphatase family protein [Bacteroidales bacterium]